MTQDERQAEPQAPHNLVYRLHEEDGPATADNVLSPLLTESLGAVVAEERELHRGERARELAPLQRELAELRGKLDVLLLLLQGAKADVLPLEGRKHA